MDGESEGYTPGAAPLEQQQQYVGGRGALWGYTRAMTQGALETFVNLQFAYPRTVQVWMSTVGQANLSPRYQVRLEWAVGSAFRKCSLWDAGALGVLTGNANMNSRAGMMVKVQAQSLKVVGECRPIAVGNPVGTLNIWAALSDGLAGGRSEPRYIGQQQIAFANNVNFVACNPPEQATHVRIGSGAANYYNLVVFPTQGGGTIGLAHPGSAIAQSALAPVVPIQPFFDNYVRLPPRRDAVVYIARTNQTATPLTNPADVFIVEYYRADDTDPDEVVVS